MPVATAIVLFRRDLRLHDNVALRRALAGSERVVPVYIHDALSDHGDASRWWLHHSLLELAAGLEERGAKLVVRRAQDVQRELLQLMRDTGAQEVHWNRLYEPAAVERDHAVKSSLNQQGVAVFTHAGQLLHEPTRLLTNAGTPYRVFTPFWKALLAQTEVRAPEPAPIVIPTLSSASLAVEDLGLLPGRNWTSGLAECWQPGESGALERLQLFVHDRLEGYARGRDYPSEDHTSRLSPNLHFGEISPAQVWHAVQSADAPDVDKEAFLRELGFRDFAQHVLFHFPHTVSDPMHEKYRHFPWRESHDELLRAWQKGETGYPIVDAGMRQLWRTGWVHNRARMIVASLLVKNLRVPWQKGAAWFMDTLVDADLANNTFNWQWAAGCGADAAPYFRIFNPVTQSERFDAAAYIREYVPELRALPDKWIHKPWEMPESVRRDCDFTPGKDYPLPVVDYRESREQALAALKSLRAD